MTTTPHQRLEAARRELSLRYSVYPGLVQRGKMTQATADYQLAVMTDIVEVLRQATEADTQQELFAPINPTPL